MPVSCFVFARRFRLNPEWRSLHRFTLAAGTTIAIAVAVLTIATKVIPLQSAFSRWLGLIQRAAIVPFLAWLCVFALALRRIHSRIKNIFVSISPQFQHITAHRETG
jgi:hypothetical protein